jgi:exosortase E/protease (VPEID-CTERM system)
MPPAAHLANHVQTYNHRDSLFSFKIKLFLTGLLLISELICITVALDAQPLLRMSGLAYLLGVTAHWGLYAVILSMSLALALAWPRVHQILRTSPPDGSGRSFSLHAAVFHVCAAALFYWFAALLCQATSLAGHGWIAILAVAAGASAFFSTFLIFIRASFWKQLAGLAPRALAYGLLAAIVTIGLFNSTQRFVGLWMHLTFTVVYDCLLAIRSDVVADPTRFVLGTKTFNVEVAPACSGYEGVALMLAFGSVWLLFFRREFRFPQALLLIPGGMLAIWILNCVRLVSLILIGDAGAPQIALGGFHSQAGWIAFVGMAILFSILCQKVPGMAAALPVHSTRSDANSIEKEDQTSAFLLPFLAILAAGMLAQSVSAGFEWFYPLRVFSAAAALFCYRRVYVGLRWRASWEAVAIGFVVFLLWIGMDRLINGNNSIMPVPPEFAAASLTARSTWSLFRLLGATITVPIAEELAFRGYLLRRFVAADFAKVNPQRFTVASFLVSSILFGILHGRQWAPGIAAGMFYAWVFQRRGRIGDAVLAHSVTNGLLAGWVLFAHDWKYW